MAEVEEDVVAPRSLATRWPEGFTDANTRTAPFGFLSQMPVYVPYRNLRFIDDFLSFNASEWIQSGTGTVVQHQATTTTGGIIRLTTAAVAGQFAQIQTKSAGFEIVADQFIWIRSRFRVPNPTTLADTEVFFGLASKNTDIDLSSDFFGFEIENTEIEFILRDNFTELKVELIDNLEKDRFYRLDACFNAQRNVFRIYVDTVLAAVVRPPYGSAFPSTTTLAPAFQAESEQGAGGSAVSVDVDYIEVVLDNRGGIF